MTHKERPADGSTQWSTRTLAARVGIGKDAVAKIWADHNLKPWKIETFKVSNDPRSRRSSSMWSGAVAADEAAAEKRATMTHDYRRNGTIDLFAALDVATGEVLTDLRKGHAGADVLRFFKQIDASRPARSEGARRPRQLVRPLHTGDPAPALHAHFEFLAEPDRALVQGTHR